MMVNNSNKVPLIIGGIFLIAFLTFFKFLRPRASGPMSFGYTDIAVISYTITLVSLLIIFSVILYLYISEIYGYLRKTEEKDISKDQKIKKSFILKKIQLFFINKFVFFNKIYNDAVDAVYLPILNIIWFKYNRIWIKFVDFAASPKVIRNFHIIAIIFYFLPPCFISLTYFIEVVVFNHITYFPYTIFLGIIPIIFRTAIYSLRKYCEKFAQDSLSEICEEESEETIKYTWAKTCTIPEEAQTEELLSALGALKIENNKNLNLFNEYHKALLRSDNKIYILTFSLLCGISTFSYMLYKTLF